MIHRESVRWAAVTKPGAVATGSHTQRELQLWGMKTSMAKLSAGSGRYRSRFCNRLLLARGV